MSKGVRQAKPTSYEDAMALFSQKSEAEDKANEQRRSKTQAHLNKIKQDEYDEEYDDEADYYGDEAGAPNIN